VERVPPELRVTTAKWVSPALRRKGTPMSTASDYDARRVSDVETVDRSSLRELAPALQKSSAVIVDDDANDALFELPDAELSGEELLVTVIPARRDEFTCSSCHLVQHRSRLRSVGGAPPICADCV
jgi:hypothetical protein